jgi:hypothetical protein
VAWTFREDVAGISDTSAVVLPAGYSRFYPAPAPPAVEGSWSCTTADGAPVSCATGPLRTISFTPATPFAADGRYEMWLNPEHVLDATDLAGNPAQPGFGNSFRIVP